MSRNQCDIPLVLARRFDIYSVSFLVGAKYRIDWIDRHITIRANHITNIPTINRMTIWLCAFVIPSRFPMILLANVSDWHLPYCHRLRTHMLWNRSWRKWEFCAIFGFARTFVPFTNEDNEIITLMDVETWSWDFYIWYLIDILYPSTILFQYNDSLLSENLSANREAQIIFFDDVFFAEFFFPLVRSDYWRRLRLATFYHEIIPSYPNSKQ